MRNALRSFLAWLDTRFPEKVVVTEKDYQELKGRIAALAQMQESEFRTLKGEISKLNAAMGFGSVGAALRAGALHR